MYLFINLRGYKIIRERCKSLLNRSFILKVVPEMCIPL